MELQFNGRFLCLKEKQTVFIIFIAILLVISGCGNKGKEDTKTKENRLVYASEAEFEGLESDSGGNKP